jgi:serine protease Do
MLQKEVPRMRRLRCLAGLIAGLVFLAGSPVAEEGGLRTVRLRSGSIVRGEILKTGTDRVIVDLGYTVMEIPADEIERIDDDGEPAGGDGSATLSGDIYLIAADRRELTVKENLERCGEAVVQVRSSIGLGSGFIIHPDGYVVTNHHVIAGEHDLTVTMFEEGDRELRRVPYSNVRIVATNPFADLALLKIEDAGRGELTPVPLGDSSRLRQGQTVFAIGSPLGLERTVSQGIVSLKNRPLGGRIFIQSTAQINMGNSGGPLFNLRGEVVGVNNMKIAAAGIEGLGFAVPANTLKDFLDNRDAFAFDVRHPNAGFRYNRPPGQESEDIPQE